MNRQAFKCNLRKFLVPPVEFEKLFFHLMTQFLKQVIGYLTLGYDPQEPSKRKKFQMSPQLCYHGSIFFLFLNGCHWLYIIIVIVEITYYQVRNIIIFFAHYWLVVNVYKVDIYLYIYPFQILVLYKILQRYHCSKIIGKLN